MTQDFQNGMAVGMQLNLAVANATSNEYTEKVLYRQDGAISGKVALADNAYNYDFIRLIISDYWAYNYVTNGTLQYVNHMGVQTYISHTRRFTNHWISDDGNSINFENYNGGTNVVGVVGIKFNAGTSITRLTNNTSQFTSTCNIQLTDSVKNYDYLIANLNFYNDSATNGGESAHVLEPLVCVGKRIELGGYNERKSYIYIYPNDLTKVRFMFSEYRLNSIYGVKIGM